MKKSHKKLFVKIVNFLGPIFFIGSIIWIFFYSDSWYYKLQTILGIILFFFWGKVFWRFPFADYALNNKPSLIPRFFKDKPNRRHFDVLEYYYLGRYHFMEGEYEKAEKFFYKSVEAYFYKLIKLNIDKSSDDSESLAKQLNLEKDIDTFYENHNDFVAFIKASKLYISKSYVFFIAQVDTSMYKHRAVSYFVKTRKIISEEDDFLYDFDEDKMLFLDNIEPEKADKSGIERVLLGSADLDCVKAFLLLGFDKKEYLSKSVEITTRVIDKKLEDKGSSVFWRAFYIRGLAYLKMGRANLACQDWKRATELGDFKYSKEAIDKNCKDF